MEFVFSGTKCGVGTCLEINATNYLVRSQVNVVRIITLAYICKKKLLFNAVNEFCSAFLTLPQIKLYRLIFKCLACRELFTSNGPSPRTTRLRIRPTTSTSWLAVSTETTRR